MSYQEKLKALKVVELAQVLAGPAVGMFFAELGAEVVKVENILTGGDLTRKWKVAGEDPSTPLSAYYHTVNWHKKVLMMNLSEEKDQSALHVLLKDADILLVNFKAGDAEKFGLVSSVLRDRYPRLIIGEIIGYVDSDRVAYDAVLQAESGFMYMNGEAGDPPLKMPVALIDLLAAHQLKEALLLAVLKREWEGTGSVVSVALYNAAVASLANQASTYLNTGIIPVRQGSLHPGIAPYGEVFTTADQVDVLLAVGTDEQFRRLMDVLQLEELFSEAKFQTNAERVIHRKELKVFLSSAISKVSSTDLLQQLSDKKVPAAAIKNLAEVFSEPVAADMVLTQLEENGKYSKRVSTVAFKID
jgi:crotonobetainyl-CoA:carnitine CoA-transferase CaiB-like acyl-CoA transferase